MFAEYVDKSTSMDLILLRIIKVQKYTSTILLSCNESIRSNSFKQHIKIHRKLFVDKVPFDILKTLGGRNFGYSQYSDEFTMIQRTEAIICSKYQNKKAVEL